MTIKGASTGQSSVTIDISCIENMKIADGFLTIEIVEPAKADNVIAGMAYEDGVWRITGMRVDSLKVGSAS